MSLGAKVAQSPSVSYVTYSGNKQVRARTRLCICYKAFSPVSNVTTMFSSLQEGVMLCKATAGMGVPVSVSPCVGATCPFIVFESADIDSAVDGVIETAFKKKREVISPL